MKKGLILIALTMLYLLASANEILANFGQSCVTLPVDSSDDYLNTDTAYGHLIGNIDTMTYVSGCDPTTSEILFCFQNPPLSTTPCSDPIEIGIGESKTLGEINSSPSLGGNVLLKDIILSVVQIGSDICLIMPTSRGQMPITCKASNTTSASDPSSSDVCKVIGNSCFDGHTKSQSPFNFSGMAVNCLKESLDNVFYGTDGCSPGPDRELLNPFAVFQKSLQLSIGAALVIYIMLFGFKIIMNNQSADLNNIATFVIKFVLVFYFAVGFTPLTVQSPNQETNNGMLDIAIPLFSQITPELAEIVFNAGGSQGLCSFDSSKYQPGYESYGLWDSIDCRIGYYLGMRVMDDTASIYQGLSSTQQGGTGNAASGINSSNNTEINSLQNDESFRFFSVLFGFLLGGNIIILISGIVFVVIFISILLHFLTSYLVCLVTLYAMAYISPIFVPMALFNRTKGYFDSWLKIMIACSLQPAVLAGFIALLVTMYDSAIYENCEFARHDYVISGQNYSTFELRIPGADPELCTGSAGFKIINYYGQTGWDSMNLILFEIPYLTDVLNLLVNLTYVLIFTIIFYYFSKFISQFASEITSGPAMDAVTASPTKVVELANKAINFVIAVATKDTKQLKESAQDAVKGSRPDGKGSGGGGSSDSLSGGKDSKKDSGDKIGGKK